MMFEFTRDTKQRESSTPYTSGQVVDLPQDQVDRWMKRGAGRLFAGKPKQTTADTADDAAHAATKGRK